MTPENHRRAAQLRHLADLVERGEVELTAARVIEAELVHGSSYVGRQLYPGYSTWGTRWHFEARAPGRKSVPDGAGARNGVKP